MGRRPTTDRRPGPGSSLALAWTVPPAGFDPHTGPENLGFPGMAPVYDRLVELQADGSLAPMLATSWQFTDGGSRLELTLRRDVCFHDGTPFDADAVRINLARATSPEASPVVARQLSPVAGVEVLDAHRICFDVSPRAAGVPAYLATAAGMMVSPRALEGGDLTRPVGTGPYVLDGGGHDPGRRATFVPRPDGYWDAGIEPVGRLTLVGMADHEARFDALLGGEVDLCDLRGATVAAAGDRARAGELQVASRSTDVTVALQFSRRSPHLADLRLRRAVNLAIDRQAIATHVFSGRARPTVQSLGPGCPGHQPELEDLYPHDLAAARRLVAAAGATGRRLATLVFADLEPVSSMLDVIADQLAEAGLILELHPHQPADLVAAWQAGGYDMRAVFASSLPDPALVLERRLNPVQNPGDLATFSSALPPLADRLLDQRMVPAAAEELHRDVNRHMVEDAVMAEVCRLDLDVAARPHVTGVAAMGFTSLNLYDPRPLGVAPERAPTRS